MIQPALPLLALPLAKSLSQRVLDIAPPLLLLLCQSLPCLHQLLLAHPTRRRGKGERR
jgi:hypothetical protein